MGGFSTFLSVLTVFKNEFCYLKWWFLHWYSKGGCGGGIWVYRLKALVCGLGLLDMSDLFRL